MKLQKRTIKFFGLICLFLCIVASIFLAAGCSSPCEHVEGAWIVDQEATLYSEGSQHTVCTKCGETLQTEPIPSINATKKNVTDKLKNSVIKIYSYAFDGKTIVAQGSGFFINDKGVFITNAHVVEGSYFLKVRVSGLSTALKDVGHIYEYNKARDYAVCGLERAFKSTPVEFAEEATAGETVFSLGYPNDTRVLSTTFGKIIDADTTYNQTHYYSSDCEIDHGSSGGILANSKGQVLGITSGEFEDGTYASIKYAEFSKAVDRKGYLSSAKAPLDYFHKSEKAVITGLNFETYFDIIVTATPSPFVDTSVSYSVMVKLKDIYAQKNVDFGGNMTATVEIKTKYSYYEEGTYIDTLQTKTDTQYLYFRFGDLQEMIKGKTQTTTSSIFLSYLTKYHGMNTTYSTDVSGLINATLAFYD